ncbi:hypothetical protein CEP52_014807 [Fusarium oligoseptatum]|uniref:Ribonuclease H n=1 Tax=Fusarium oligoseptatum TaxID=2604345 RepID=A0A428SIZ3_9HYPO|nr:hypothetical protein CEP52_014807 [Fusarium oligoseptatum]
MAKKLIYAVFIGHTPGIYTSYDEAEKQVKGFPNNKYLSFSNRSEAVEWLREMNKKAQQEKRELEEGRELHRMKEEAAQKQRESELNEAPDLLRQTGGEAGTMESLFDQADRRAFVVDHRRTSHDQSDAGPSSRSTDGSPTSLEGTEASRGVEDQVADHASSQDIGLELRPQKKLKLSHEANSNAGKRKRPPDYYSTPLF